MRDIITEELAKGLDAYWRLSADDALDAARAGLASVLGVRHPGGLGRRDHILIARNFSASVPRWAVLCL